MKLKGANVTPDYVLAMSWVAPLAQGLDVSDYASMKAVGVTPSSLTT
jgi:hypothetical protein